MSRIATRSVERRKSIFPHVLRRRVNEFRWRAWDAWHRVDTKGRANIQSLDVVGSNREHATRYEASTSIRTILKDLQIRYQDYGFVDFGSGKGRAILSAAAFPFISVEGVEFSVALHDIALNNIRRYRGARIRCGVLRSVLADAGEYILPPLPLVLYFFNPFTGPVLTAVVENIRRSYQACPRDIIIVCVGRHMVKEPFEHLPAVEILWSTENSTAYRLPSRT